MAWHLACARPDTVSHIEFACVDDGVAHVALDKNGVGTSNYFDKYVKVTNGNLALDFDGEVLGWGIQIKEDWLKRATCQVFNADVSDSLRSGL